MKSGMLVYREKDNLIHQLHPITALTFVGVVFILALACSHPVYLVALLLATGMVIIGAGHLQEWVIYLKFSLLMIAMLMLINVVFVHLGETVLWTGPVLPVIGRFNITLEALAYAGGMGMRFLVIISAFCLYTYAIHPDKALKLFSRWGHKSVLVITLSTRLFPLMVQDYRRITEVMRCRGVKFTVGSWWERLHKALSVINVLLFSCLDRALQLAESMQVRGYASGPRSSYAGELWRPRDALILGALLVGLLCGLWSAFKGWSAYLYYPHMAAFRPEEVEMAAIIAVLLGMPAWLNWGWLKCRLLRSKI